MNKICLVLPCNLYVIPYFKVYEKMFEEMNMDYDIIIWNRSLIDEKCRGQIISYYVKDIANNRDPKKVLKYIGFFHFVKKNIVKNKYEKIVLLDTSAGTAALLAGFLSKHYRNKYWIDIRDYSFENILLYKKMLGKAINSAYCCDISSRGFLKFLPKMRNYCVTHNVDYDTINNVKITTFVQDSCIRISFIGNVRYYNLNIKLLDLLKNDERFRIQFYGTESEKIRDYCVTNGIRNVDFEGRFPFEKTAFFYQKTDLINNIYGNETMEVSTALSNKLYYAAYLDKPILVSNNTYMSDVVKKYNLGYVVDLNNNNLADDIYTWYIQYKENPSTMRQSFIDKIEKEFKDYQEKFKKFIQETS